jgi:hypothetical protein
MTNCTKCGSELAEGAGFCGSCGASVYAAPNGTEKRKDETRPGRILIGVGVLIIGIAIVLSAIFFLPARPVNETETRDVPHQTGVERIDLDFWADIAEVNIDFADLPNSMFTLDLTVSGGVGLFDDPKDYDFTFSDSTAGGTLTVVVEIDTPDDWNLFLDVVCDIRIDSSLDATIDVMSNTGKVALNTESGVEFDSLILKTNTGPIEANLVQGVKISGDILLSTNTAGIDLNWRNLDVTDDIDVQLGVETGELDVSIKQDDRGSGDVILNGHTTTGGIDFSIDLQGDVGGRIQSSTDTGGIHAHSKAGFSGSDSDMQSENYPDSENFIVTLGTNTGGIDIDAKHSP